jgi:hypothetical protein
MNYFIFIFSLVISLAAFWFSIKFIRLYFKVKKWKRVNATILKKEMFIHPKYSTARSPYGIKVEYTFNDNDTDYKGNKLYLVELIGGQGNHMKNVAENKLAKIKETMSIYVNPKDMQQSVIFCNGIGLYVFMFFMAIVSLLIGISKVI